VLKISDTLAKNTKKIINEWSDESAATQAIYLFQGDAFQKLNAAALDHDAVTFAQDHVIILSALYGYLRPLDAVFAYRLDMKDGLKIPAYSNLYHYWKETVTQGINRLLQQQKNKILLNLASDEYVNMIDLKQLNATLINVDFKIQKENVYKTIGVYAKRGRGLLARHILENKIDTPEQIIQFNGEGFRFSDIFSTPDRYVFCK
jgi:cytoplasmic iron level regulating protein YaaA (DUF328/UPF0246 family)